MNLDGAVHHTAESNSIAEPEFRNFGSQQSEVQNNFVLCTNLAFRLLLRGLLPHHMPLYVKSIAGNMTKHSLVRLSSSNKSSRILFRTFSLSSSNSSQAAFRAASIDCCPTRTHENRHVRRHEHAGVHAHAHTYKQICKQINKQTNAYTVRQKTHPPLPLAHPHVSITSFEIDRILSGVPRNHPVISFHGSFTH